MTWQSKYFSHIFPIETSCIISQHSVLGETLTSNFSNTNKVHGIDTRIHVKVIWWNQIFPLSSLTSMIFSKSLFYYTKIKEICHKWIILWLWLGKWLQREKMNMLYDSYMDSGCKNVYLIYVRNIKGWNPSQDTLWYKHFCNDLQS